MSNKYRKRSRTSLGIREIQNKNTPKTLFQTHEIGNSPITSSRKNMPHWQEYAPTGTPTYWWETKLVQALY